MVMIDVYRINYRWIMAPPTRWVSSRLLAMGVAGVPSDHFAEVKALGEYRPSVSNQPEPTAAAEVEGRPRRAST
jgi:hypothetical protein